MNSENEFPIFYANNKRNQTNGRIASNNDKNVINI